MQSCFRILDVTLELPRGYGFILKILNISFIITGDLDPYSELLHVNESNISIATDMAIEQTNGLMVFGHWFTKIHGYASLFTCIFGIFTNLFNISILTRKDMWNPTNCLLTWLAVSDILTMIPYIPFSLHFYCIHNFDEISEEKFSRGWTTYMLVLVNLAATTHTISIWLGVSLAVFRFTQLRNTAKGPLARKRSMRQVKCTTILVYILSTLCLIPNYMTNKVVQQTLDTNMTIYVLNDLKLATNETEPIVLANVLSYAIIAKFIPCALMIVFGGSLLYSLGIKGRHRRTRLSAGQPPAKRGTKHSKTTKMLLVVIILFLVTEFPQGIVIFMSAIVPEFYKSVYVPLGDFMDFLALVNNAINFVLYCSMSNQFRSRFLEMYCNRRRGFKYTNKFSFTYSLSSFTKNTSVIDHSLKK